MWEGWRAGRWRATDGARAGPTSLFSPPQLDLAVRPLPGYAGAQSAAAAHHLVPHAAPPPLAAVVWAPGSAAEDLLPLPAALLAATDAGVVLVFGAGGAPDGDRVRWLKAPPPSDAAAAVVAALAAAGVSLEALPPPFPPVESLGNEPAITLASWCGRRPPAAACAPRAAFTPSTATRETPPDPSTTVLLIIDAQNYTCRREGGLWQGREGEGKYFFSRLEGGVEAAWVTLLAAARSRGVRVVFTVMAAKTGDGRDLSADYKASGFAVPRGCWDAAVLPTLTPLRNEIVLAKGSCSAFVSTALDNLLRSLGAAHVSVAGVVADQCVAAAVMTACDLGYGVTLVTDATAAGSATRDAAARVALAGFCRQRAAAAVVAEWEESGGGAAG